MSTITMTVSRDVTGDEVNDMIFGTGVLASEWWVNATRLPDGDSWRFTCYDGEHEDGTTITKVITTDEIAAAFTEALTYEHVDPASSDTKEAFEDSLGALDALAADVILQYAMYGEIVYS